MFTPTVPALIRDASRRPRAGSAVQTVAMSPYLTSLAIRIASFSSSNGVTVTTGPKISSCETVMELSPSPKNVGGNFKRGTPAEVAEQGEVRTDKGVEGIIRAHFDAAVGHGRREVLKASK